MKSILKVLGSIAFLAVPLCVSADRPSDTSAPLSLSLKEEYLTSAQGDSGMVRQLISDSLNDAAEADLFSSGDIDDEILLSSLMEESPQEPEPSGDQHIMLAEADSRQGGKSARKEDGNGSGENDYEDTENYQIADPLYYWNTAMYHFNDKFYFWLMKPVAQGYTAIAPEPVRIAVSNFFQNLTTPIRFAGNLLQLKLKNAGDELVRFVTNSTQGLGGFMDVARSHYGISTHDEDIGQALGSYGIGHGFYLVWPFFGPSSLRDTFGLAGDTLLNPVTYVNPAEAAVGIRAYDMVNETTFHIGDYEAMKDAAIDPYVSMRNGYLQHRSKQVEE
jgi:phospholipid-binding lipoprotein MlaA